MVSNVVLRFLIIKVSRRFHVGAPQCASPSRYLPDTSFGRDWNHYTTNGRRIKYPGIP
jgi:hypothetical protein